MASRSEANRGDGPREPSSLRQRLLAFSMPALGLTLLCAAVWVLRREMRSFHFDDVVEHLQAIPTSQLLAATALTLCGYAVLTGYDALAFHYVRRTLPYPRIALASFVAYVFSHNVGISFFGGGAIRFRMLTAWGVKTDDVARVVAFTALTFWIGFFSLGGILLTFWPLPVTASAIPIDSSRPIGCALLAIALAYFISTLVRRKPISLRGFRIDVPSPRIGAAQLALSTADWMLAAGVLYALLPHAEGLHLPVFVGAYLLAQAVGVISHVPGGFGVFEITMVVLLKPWLAGDEVLASILVYRVVYYLVPFSIAVCLLAGFEIRTRRIAVEQTGARLQGWAAELVPRFLSITTFLAGALLLLSGATPELPDRLHWLQRTLPVPLIEVSNLLGSVVGVLLLVLANAIRERLDAAYFGALLLLAGGAVMSLAKGLDWEEAAILATMALVLLPCRAYFYRRSSLVGQPLAPGWWLGVAAVAVGALAAWELAYRHVEYSNELWWRVGPDSSASRSLRAMLAAGVALAAVGTLRLLRPAPPAPESPLPGELDRAQEIASGADRTEGRLALLGDKRLLFHEDGASFLMYGVSGRTWVAMGDPVGPETDWADLAWRFRELADRHGARAVFYEVSDRALPLCLDLGLDLHKLGEEARVPLQAFSLEGSARKALRQTQHRMDREGCIFEVVPAAQVAPLLDELEAISNAWLAEKGLREKRFSLGFFDRAYLQRTPVAVARREGHIVAFANLWTTDSKAELSIDLMRYAESAPPGAMEYLLTQLMLWGRDEGYRYCNLGMAPLSGFERRRLAPLWNRMGSLLFHHGERFYNFRGLRTFKEKFEPEWEARYLAAPGDLTTPLVLGRIASLISGGLAGIATR